MNVLIACEESQEVCKAFRALGHNAFSCDIQECSGGHPEWHILEDCTKVINGRCVFLTQAGTLEVITGRWDLLIAHPPCTDLCVSGSRFFEKKRADGRQRRSIEFFCQFLHADCDRIAIENPIGIISGKYIADYFPDLCEKHGLPLKHSQVIQPFEYGHPVSKATCLWLKGLPPYNLRMLSNPKSYTVKAKRAGIRVPCGL